MMPTVEVIIATTASAERGRSLFEAIDSVLQQTGVQATPRIVVNGSRYDKEVFETLQARSDIKLHYEEEGNLPKAIALGRMLVESEFFGFLDDDDILLENALVLKLREFSQNPATDVVVGNGYFDTFGTGVLMGSSFDDCRSDPLAALMESNWLASCGGLFKTATIYPSYFLDLPKYFEWTWVAFNLALNGKQVQFIDTPTFHVRDSEDSLSKGDENIDAFIAVVEQMSALACGHPIQKQLKKRLGAAYHMGSQKALKDGLINDAWNYHFRSINTLGNLGYLTFTRHLLWRSRAPHDQISGKS